MGTARNPVLWNAHSQGGRSLAILATLVSAYEDKHFPTDVSDAIEAIESRMEQMGLKRSNVEPLIQLKTSRMGGPIGAAWRRRS